MANDPGFIFYPGDYLRDTQCLSEKSQVAYDRIMCEHMRNICISQKQLIHFTKKLNPDEFSELEMVLEKVEGGFQIGWVASSILKRRAYSESRSSNRKGKTEDISSTYVKHMDNEIEIDSEDIVEPEVEKKERKTFSKPAVFEIHNYLLEKYPNSNFDGALEFAKKFWSHYENVGWKVGKNKMKSWMLAMVQWDETLQKMLFPNKPIQDQPTKNHNQQKIETFDALIAGMEDQIRNPQIQIGNGENS